MAVTQAICTLQSVSPISFSRYYDIEHLDQELPHDYEKRTWRERLHYDKKTGECYIPPIMFKHCLSEAAKYLGMKIKSKGQATYTKHFLAGILVTDPLLLGVHKDKVESITLFVDSRGRPGGSNRVIKYFPEIPEWHGQVVFYMLDPIITENVFREHLIQAGNFIGLGRFRPRNGGYYGRFTVTNLKWNANGGSGKS